MIGANPTVTLAALLAFHSDPGVDDLEWLLNNACAVIFAFDESRLPHGGWVCQGYEFECVVEIQVAAGSAAAQMALANAFAP